MNYTDFLVDRAQHMRPLEYDLSENYNALVHYLHDMGILDNVPVATLGPADILSASDSLAIPLRSLVVGGNSTQDGTPTPDAPVEILSVVDPVLTFVGKNWLDIHAGRKTSTSAAKDGSGVWYPYAVGNYLNNFSGNSLSIDGDTVTFVSKSSYGFGVEARVLPNSTYTFSAQSITVSDSAAYDIRMNYFRKDGTFTYRTLGTNVNKVTTTIPSDAIYAVFVISVSGNALSTITVKGLQLEIGSTATAYEPYQGHTVTLPVTLRSLPDGTKDELHLSYLRPSTRAGWAWYAGEVTRVTGKVTYDGTENWRGNGSWYGYYIKAPNDAAASAPANAMLNTHGIGTAYSSAGMTSALGATALGSSFISYNWDNAPGSGRITPFKEWLAESNMTVMYPLATPVTTTLEPIELPVLPAPNVTVWATADATPMLTAQYVRDISAAINDMQEAIADI